MRRRLVPLLLAVALLATGCAVPPPSPTATTTAASGRVLGLEQITHDDPTLPVHVQWPVVPGATRLNTALAGWAADREREFLADNGPASDAPPELTGTWELALDTPSMVAVRQTMYEFAGASGATTSRTTYADPVADRPWSSADLFRPDARQQAAAAVLAAIRASGRAPSMDAADPAVLLTDLTFVGGDLVARIGEGEVSAFSDGSYDVRVPRSTTDPLLSDDGARARDAAGTAPQGTPSATAPASPPVPTAPANTPARPAAPASVDCATAKCVALTFDDGPGPHTARLLDELATLGVRATFFTLGSSVTVYPQVVRRAVAEGHVVGNHTFSHKQLTKLSPAQQRDEFDRANAALVAAGVPAATIMRPPYGSLNDGTRALGVPIILWDVDTLDWKNRNAAETTRLALASTRPGSIVLMHDIHPSTVAAVPGIVARLKEQGYTFVTVPELLPDAVGGQKYLRR